MARTVKTAKLDSVTARNKLKKGRQAHWEALQPKIHLGYQRWKGGAAGRWILRRYLGEGNKYRVTSLDCIADDAQRADGISILSHEQASAKARAMIETPAGKIPNITVRQAMERYITAKRDEGKPASSIADISCRGNAYIIPALGDLQVAHLTADRLNSWKATMAVSPAMKRSKAGKAQYGPEPEGDEAVRRRRSSANRVLTILKAILNHAFDTEQVSNRDAWGRRLKPFKNVDTARLRFLTIAEVQRFINGCDPEFRPLARAALETGARYSELARLDVADFHPDSGTIAIRKSKTDKVRHIYLTEDGSAFFARHCAGRSGHEVMFTHRVESGAQSPWKKSDQTEPMQAANERAKLKPRITFHGLRHTWASLAVMNEVPLIVVAQNLGHADTQMVEKHYGHLAKSYVERAIREGAPKFGIKPDKKVVQLR
jgi:integrase